MKCFNFLLLIFVISLASCSSDEVEEQQLDDLSGLHLITEITTDSHTIELYSESGFLKVGHNQVSLRIKDLATGEYLTDTEISWQPIMQMTNMEHAAPASEVVRAVQSTSLYTGHLVFTMPDNQDEKWELLVNFRSGESTYSDSIPLTVGNRKDRTLVSFTGSDQESYVLAVVQPFEPSVAINDIQMVLYRMVSMMEYVPVDDFKILLDPRMPGMGNHGSPNNVHFTQKENGIYHGKLSMTMTGLWRINLQVQNGSEQTIAGEPVTESNPHSNIYLQFEF